MKLRISHIEKTYSTNETGRRLRIINDLSLEIEGSELVCLVGPSGCGKSTLLRLIAGLEQPDSGDIQVDGQPIDGPHADRGMIFQDYALFPWRSVQKNVEFGLEIRGVPARDRGGVTAKLIHMVGLAGFENRFPHQLSGGMRQRVAIARALAADPKVILMDEPFASLDSQVRKQMQHELLRILQEARKTIVFVTHSVEEAVYLGDRVVVLTGRPARIKADYRLDLPRPRDPLDERFIAFRRLVLGLLERPDPVAG